MKDHFIVTLDRGHLRIYSETSAAGQSLPRLEIVEAMDFPPSRESFATGEEQFPHLRESNDPFGERRASKREEERRAVAVLAGELDAFLLNRPRASWDFAAAPGVFNAVVEALSSDARRRLKRALSKDLVNQDSEEVHAHFVNAGR